MRERRREYELLYIVSPLRTTEEEIGAAIERVSQMITTNGGEVSVVDHSSPWGRRRFAFPIREYAEGESSRRIFTEGYYVICRFTLATTKINELERVLKLSDAVLRYLLTLYEPMLVPKAERGERGERAEVATEGAE